MSVPNETGAIARHRIAPDAHIGAVCAQNQDLILNIEAFALHITPEQARHIQHELTTARIEHAMRYGEGGDRP